MTARRPADLHRLAWRSGTPRACSRSAVQRLLRQLVLATVERAAVDMDHLSGNEAAFFRGEPAHGRSNLSSPPEATHGGVLGEAQDPWAVPPDLPTLSISARAKALRSLRLGPTRSRGGALVLRSTPSRLHTATPRSLIQSMTLPMNLHDPPPTTLDHPRPDRLDAAHGTKQGQIELSAPRGWVGVQEWAGAAAFSAIRALLTSTATGPSSAAIFATPPKIASRSVQSKGTAAACPRDQRSLVQLRARSG